MVRGLSRAERSFFAMAREQRAQRRMAMNSNRTNRSTRAVRKRASSGHSGG